MCVLRDVYPMIPSVCRYCIMWLGSITNFRLEFRFLRLESRLRSVGDLLQDVRNNEVLCILEMERWPYHWFTIHSRGKTLQHLLLHDFFPFWETTCDIVLGIFSIFHHHHCTKVSGWIVSDPTPLSFQHLPLAHQQSSGSKLKESHVTMVPMLPAIVVYIYICIIYVCICVCMYI